MRDEVTSFSSLPIKSLRRIRFVLKPEFMEGVWDKGIPGRVSEYHNYVENIQAR